MANGRGSEDSFKAIVDSLAKNCKKYETGSIKHVAFTENMDNYFVEYGWSKKEFYKELNVRLGIANREETAKEVKSKKKVVRKKSNG